MSEEKGANRQAEQDPLGHWPVCPRCNEPWLRPSQLPGSYRCVYCLVRFQLLSHCPSCGEHSTIVRMSDTANMTCVRCGGSMLKPV
jgi:zinc ribbon protein